MSPQPRREAPWQQLDVGSGEAHVLPACQTETSVAGHTWQRRAGQFHHRDGRELLAHQPRRRVRAAGDNNHLERFRTMLTDNRFDSARDPFSVVARDDDGGKRRRRW